MNGKTEQSPDFEKALAELETLVEKLEGGELTLDESLAHFRRGVELTRQCQDVLDRAQLAVERLVNPDDEASTEPIDPDA